ncbi:aminotransferase, putative [Bodo saltans]|uniref:Aminotransferase, putative n=1 Tax=Bodo saltans TaxID=75058 RepID=A0A0S4J2R1_BODSA|nr:aminotransferase, putative [Bodo saltans]|eukprot:CUG85415.1 aminotransferase, putative [Bodo saltans]
MLKDAEESFADVLKYRRAELPELATISYLDYMGSGLAPKAVRCSSTSLMCNPHSLHSLGHAASVEVRAARHQTEMFFEAAEEYDLVFTSGCTSSLHLVGSLIPFGSSGCVFMHPLAHNSLLGVREFVSSDRYFCVRDASTATSLIDLHASTTDMNLLCVPAECNLSGARLDFASFVGAVHSSVTREVLIVVDGAAIAGKAPVTLDGSGIDFFAFSFYKMFGAPTGLGGLFVKKGRPQEMLMSHKKYFGGGTVSFNDHTKHGSHHLRSAFTEAMEDGTQNFYGIAQVRQGFRALDSLGGVTDISHRIQYLRTYCVDALQHLRHRNGAPLILVYHAPSTSLPIVSWGSSVAFAVLEQDGTVIGHALTEKLLAGLKVYVRGGCMCNPGACAEFVGYSAELMTEARNAGHQCGDEMDVLDGKPLGCVRASFGASSLPLDVDRLVAALAQCFLRDETKPELVQSSSALRLRKIILYPLKGMMGVSVDTWPLQTNGLAFDREWMLIDQTSGTPVAPKRFAVMSTFEVSLDWQLNVLTVQHKDKVPIHIVIDEDRQCWIHNSLRCTVAPETKAVKLKNRTLPTYRTYEEAADQWFSSVLGIPVQLARNLPSAEETLSNSAALLVVHEGSHHQVLRHMNAVDRPFVSLASYRPNLVVTGAAPSNNGSSERSRGASPFVENLWRSLSIGTVQLVATGPCKRCQQVNVGAGELKHEPLASISSLCRRSGLTEILFGQLFGIKAVTAAPVVTTEFAVPWTLPLVALGVALALRLSPLAIPALACAKIVKTVAQRPLLLAEIDGVLIHVGMRVRVGE